MPVVGPAGAFGVAFADDPVAALQAVQDAGDRRGVQAGAFGQGAGAQRAVPVDQVQAVQVDVLQVDTHADVVAEQGQLVVQVAQRVLDRRGQAPVVPGPLTR